MRSQVMPRQQQQQTLQLAREAAMGMQSLAAAVSSSWQGWLAAAAAAEALHRRITSGRAVWRASRGRQTMEHLAATVTREQVGYLIEVVIQQPSSNSQLANLACYDRTCHLANIACMREVVIQPNYRVVMCST
jgi:hypothetical protein